MLLVCSFTFRLCSRPDGNIGETGDSADVVKQTLERPPADAGRDEASAAQRGRGTGVDWAPRRLPSWMICIRRRKPSRCAGISGRGCVRAGSHRNFPSPDPGSVTILNPPDGCRAVDRRNLIAARLMKGVWGKTLGVGIRGISGRIWGFKATSIGAPAPHPAALGSVVAKLFCPPRKGEGGGLVVTKEHGPA